MILWQQGKAYSQDLGEHVLVAADGGRGREFNETRHTIDSITLSARSVCSKSVMNMPGATAGDRPPSSFSQPSPPEILHLQRRADARVLGQVRMAAPSAAMKAVTSERNGVPS
jgi:hypothetical protein